MLEENFWCWVFWHRFKILFNGLTTPSMGFRWQCSQRNQNNVDGLTYRPTPSKFSPPTDHTILYVSLILAQTRDLSPLNTSACSMSRDQFTITKLTLQILYHCEAVPNWYWILFKSFNIFWSEFLVYQSTKKSFIFILNRWCKFEEKS